ncbi:hypothetical protein BKA62DRAFT_740991 [Auriculariales sp. MPI-PUGE-AT-0066]|nr:hypothetical protein BKA62DRAFT_740991 [Auriculariales sp. MPI-PUGE-AT-0066]
MVITNNRISKIAFVGAGGNSGKPIVNALLKTGNFTVTALTRAGSKSTLPAASNKDALTAALRDQDVLVVTLSVEADKGTHARLNEAAAAAGVPWMLPNYWSPDASGTIDKTLAVDVPVFAAHAVLTEQIKSLGVTSYIGVQTGFWYEWCLAATPLFGFDFAQRKVTFFDDGATRMSVSTFDQVGRGVAALLSLPVQSEGSGASLENYRNTAVNIASFTISQKDMFESVLRVSGDKREDWKIEYESSAERFARGVKMLQGGDRMGFPLMLCSRNFYPVPGAGDREKHHGLINEAIGIKGDDLDEATARGIKWADVGGPLGGKKLE